MIFETEKAVDNLNMLLEDYVNHLTNEMTQVVKRVFNQNTEVQVQIQGDKIIWRLSIKNHTRAIRLIAKRLVRGEEIY